MKSKITVIVISKDKNIPLKLKNNLSFCDEVILIKKEVIEDFAQVRNEALKKSNNKWVLFLDHDEILSEPLVKEIKDLDLENTSFSGFFVTRENYFINEYVGADILVRLAKKSSGEWHRAVHEKWEIKGKLGYFNGVIIHNTSNTVFEMIKKLDNYSSVHVKENLKEGKRSNIFIILFFPIFKFIESLLKGRGIVFSILQSFHSFLAWSKQWLLQRN